MNPLIKLSGPIKCRLNDWIIEISIVPIFDIPWNALDLCIHVKRYHQRLHQLVNSKLFLAMKNVCFKIYSLGVRIVARRKWIRLGTMRLWVQSLASLSELRIRHYRELWCRSQMGLRCGTAVAVAKASRCSSSWTPSLGTSICCGHGPRKDKKTKQTKQKTNALSSTLI